MWTVEWLTKSGVKTRLIRPWWSWEDGYSESVSGKPRNAVLNRKGFGTLFEGSVLIERWVRTTIRSGLIRPWHTDGMPRKRSLKATPFRTGPYVAEDRLGFSHPDWHMKPRRSLELAYIVD